MFTKDKMILFLNIGVMVLLLTGCGQSAAYSVENPEGQSQSYSFEFQVEEMYSLTIGGVVVTGYVQSGTMCTGDGARLVKEDGTVFETRVVEMETYDTEKEDFIHPKEVGEGIPVGVLLEGLEEDQVDIGDKLLGQEL